jgi:hypothetical protein
LEADLAEQMEGFLPELEESIAEGLDAVLRESLAGYLRDGQRPRAPK